MPIADSDFTAADAGDPRNTCGWCPDMYGVRDNPAGQAWYDAMFKLYAAWGLDFIKVDDFSNPYRQGEVEMVRRAIDKCGRPIVLSTSAGPTPVRSAEHVKTHANMWRISGDFWDTWAKLNQQFDLMNSWHNVGGPGHFPDADMLPLGHICIRSKAGGNDRVARYTHDEETTLMSFWCLAPSPLMLGGNLPDNTPRDLGLITNDEVLAVNQDALASPAARVSQQGQPESRTEVWIRQLKDGSRAAGLFNRGNAAADVTLDWEPAKLSGKWTARDLWQHQDRGTFDAKLSLQVPGMVRSCWRCVRLSKWVRFVCPQPGAHAPGWLASADFCRPAGRPGHLESRLRRQRVVSHGRSRDGLGRTCAGRRLCRPVCRRKLPRLAGHGHEGRGTGQSGTPQNNPFNVPWWFRTEFDLPLEMAGRAIMLHLEGVSYRADVRLNGQRIADANQVAGAMRRFALDITKAARPGERNSLALLVRAQGGQDLGHTWVDWAPMPPDRLLGLWRDVFVSASGALRMRDPFVRSRLAADLSSADLIVSMDLENTSDKPVSGTVAVTLDGLETAVPVSVAGGATQKVSMDGKDHPGLHLAKPRLWWPIGYGPPELYNVRMCANVDNRVLDQRTVRFGVREVTSEITSDGYRLYRINHHPILIRGAGWGAICSSWKPPSAKSRKYASSATWGLTPSALRGRSAPTTCWIFWTRTGSS